jgi:hypothetical protein
MEAESMKEKVAGPINRVLEDVESEAEEAIGKRISLQTTGVNLELSAFTQRSVVQSSQLGDMQGHREARVASLGTYQ